MFSHDLMLRPRRCPALNALKAQRFVGFLWFMDELCTMGESIVVLTSNDSLAES